MMEENTCNREKNKQILAMGKMSNLVGMWAFIWDGDKLLNRVFIYGKADDQHYIVQAINSITGEPNICKIVELKNMINWTFYPTRAIANECYKDYCENRTDRYTVKLG